jgi:hypothetical protein
MTNHSRLNGFGRFVVGMALLLVALVLWFLSGALVRLLSTVALPVFIGCDVAFIMGRGHRPLIVSGVILAALILSPLEVSPFPRPGPPGASRCRSGHQGSARAGASGTSEAGRGYSPRMHHDWPRAAVVGCLVRDDVGWRRTNADMG